MDKETGDTATRKLDPSDEYQLLNPSSVLGKIDEQLRKLGEQAIRRVRAAKKVVSESAKEALKDSSEEACDEPAA